MRPSAAPSREALFSSPFQAMPRAAAGGASASELLVAFPQCSIQLLHDHVPHEVSYYAAPPQLSPSSPLFAHLLSTFVRAVQAAVSLVPAAFEGTDGLLYPPTVMLQLPSMVQGRSFKVIAESGVEGGGGAGASDDGSDGAGWGWDARRKKKSVSFSRTAALSPQAMDRHPQRIDTSQLRHFAAHSGGLQRSPQPYSHSPIDRSPTGSPLPPSLLAPSSFPLPSYTTSIPLLRSLLSRAFFPVPESALSELFAGYAEEAALLPNASAPAEAVLSRSSFQALLSTCLTASTASHPRHSAVLRTFFAHLFTLLDVDGGGSIDRATFNAGMALLLPLIPSSQSVDLDRLDIAFRLMDRASLGYLTPTALFSAASAFVPALLGLGFPLSSTVSAAPADVAPVAYSRSFDLPSLSAAVYEIAGKVVRESFGCGDLNVDGRLSEDEFRALHMARPSCLPWVNVLADPEHVLARREVRRAGVAASDSGARRAELTHSRSASLPTRVEYRRESIDKYQTEPRGHRPRQAGEGEDASNGVHAPGNHESVVLQLQQQQRDGDELDAATQLKVQQLTLGLGQRPSPSSRPPRQRTAPQTAVSAAEHAAAVEDDGDEEQTEHFLSSMWQEMRRLAAADYGSARRKRWSNDASAHGVEEREEDAAADALMAAAAAQHQHQLTEPAHVHPLSATVERPRLSALCSSSSFLSIHPHIAPFSGLRLESLLALFQLLMERNDRLSRAELPRLIASLSIGQSASSHAVMANTLGCLFTWFDTDEDDDIQSLDLVLALSAICADDSREQLHVGFALCDVDADGRLTAAQVERYLVDVMGAFFALTEQWNTLVRLTKPGAGRSHPAPAAPPAAEAAAAAAAGGARGRRVRATRE